MRFSQAVEGFWLERKREFSPATVAEYSHWYRQFGDFVKDRQLADITSDDVREWLNKRQDEGLSDKSLSNAWIALSSLWTWLESELDIPHILHGKVKRPRFRAPLIEPYTEDQVQAMMSVIDTDAAWKSRSGKRVDPRRDTAARDKAIIAALIDTGIRASELCDLTIEDYDMTSGRLHIRHGKGDKPRFVWLGETARRLLWKYLVTRPVVKDSDPLFATRNNTHLVRKNLLRMVVLFAKRAGVKRANVHRFRHTFAVNFLRNGGNVIALQELLGHENMDTIRIYVKLADVDLQLAQRRASPLDNWRV